MRFDLKHLHWHVGRWPGQSAAFMMRSGCSVFRGRAGCDSWTLWLVDTAGCQVTASWQSVLQYPRRSGSRTRALLRDGPFYGIALHIIVRDPVRLSVKSLRASLTSLNCRALRSSGHAAADRKSSMATLHTIYQAVFYFVKPWQFSPAQSKVVCLKLRSVQITHQVP